MNTLYSVIKEKSIKEEYILYLLIAISMILYLKSKRALQSKSRLESQKTFSNLSEEELMEKLNADEYDVLPLLLKKYEKHEHKYIFLQNIDENVLQNKKFKKELRSHLGKGKILLFTTFETTKRYYDYSSYDYQYMHTSTYLMPNNSYDKKVKATYSATQDRD